MQMIYKCTTDAVYREWDRFRTRAERVLPFGFCTDCTREYQHKMIAQNKCINPDLTFSDSGITSLKKPKNADKFRRLKRTVIDEQTRSKIEAMLSEQKRTGQIAKALGLPPSAVSKYISKQRRNVLVGPQMPRIPHTKKAEQNEQEILRLLREGVTRKDITEIFGISRVVLRDFLHAKKK